jgi:hypothetical protein
VAAVADVADPSASSIPYRFERTAEAADLQSRFADLAPGDETG